MRGRATGSGETTQARGSARQYGARLITPLALAVLALALAGCPMRAGGRGTASGGGTGSLSARCLGDFGTNNAAAKLESFFRSAAEFADTSYALRNDLLDACRRMGRALGVAEADLAGDGDEAVRQVCGAVNDRFRSEMTAIRGATSVNVSIEARPPHCEVSVDAYARCAAECEARVDPGSIEIRCEGGELRGRCTAECTGSCAIDVQGSCSGTCEGICEGQCSATAADGSCAGQCNGTCRGQCVARAEASCQGECRGGCSVEYEEPYCTGQVRPAEVSARCRASCDARLEAEARCTPGEMQMQVSGGVDPAMQPRVEAVQRAVREGLSSVITVRERLQRLARAGADIVRIAPELPNAAATVGIGAIACATSAAGAVGGAMTSVSVSVDVSVQVSASAQIGG